MDPKKKKILNNHENTIRRTNDLSVMFEFGVESGKNGKYRIAIEIFNKLICLSPTPEAWFYKGLALNNLNKYDEAIESFNKAIFINPNFVEAYNNKGLVLNNLNKYDEAIESFNKAIDLDSENFLWKYNKGESLRNLNRFKEAIELYDESIKINKEYIEAYLGKGISLAILKEYEESIKCFDKILEINPDPPFIHIIYNNKGLSLGHLDKCDEALENLDKATDIDPEYSDAWFNKGTIFEKLGQYNESIGCYNKALKINPKLALAYHRLGVTLGILGKYNESIEYQDKAIDLDRENADFWYSKGVSFLDLGRFEDAIDVFNETLKINPNHSEAYGNKCASLGNIGKNEEALNCFDKAIETNPNNPELWFNKGLSFLDLKRYDESIECLDQAINLDAKFALAYNTKGFILNRIGRYEEAIKYLNKTLSIDPTLDTAFNNKGISHLELDQYKNALECFNKALEINPYFNEAFVNKGSTLGNLGKYNDEIECYNKALEINPYSFEALYNKGAALSSLEKYEESIEYFSQAIEVNPNCAEAYNNKGVSFESLGKLDYAIKCYNKALEIDSSLFITHANKALILANTGKYKEAIESYDKAIKIKSDFAEAYINKGITFLNLHNYREAKDNLKAAKNIFNEKEQLNQAEEAYKYEILAVNSFNLISKLENLEKEFISYLDSKSLDDFKKKIYSIFDGINNIINESEKFDIPQDLTEFLFSKKTCFKSLLDALNFQKVDLGKFHNTKRVFEKWNPYSVIAANYIDTFIHFLSNYEAGNINSDEEKNLLKILNPLKRFNLNSLFLPNLKFFQNKKIGDIENIIKDKTIQRSHSTGKVVRRLPKFEEIVIDDTQKDCVRVGLVQLDFCLTNKFPFVLEEKEKIKEKIFNAIKIAKENEVDIICFPELSFCDEWIDMVTKEYTKGIVVCGSFYDDYNRNICKIIIDGKEYPITKCNPAIMEEKNGTGMEPGNTINIFQTKYGKIIILICRDFDCYYFPHINDFNLDLVINPRLDIDKGYKFHDKANIIIDKDDGSRENAFMLQVNANKTKWAGQEGGGGTTIIGYEHIYRIGKHINRGMRPEKGVKYNLYQVNGELMLIADLKIGPGTDRRSKFINWYKYERNQWKALNENQIWN